MGMRACKWSGTSFGAAPGITLTLRERDAHAHRSSGRVAAKLPSRVMVWFAMGAVLSNELYAQGEAPLQSHGHEAQLETPWDTASKEQAAPAGNARSPSSLEPQEGDDIRLDDIALKAAVESALKNSGLTFVELEVRVENGVVHLEGSVKSRRARRRAAMLARSVIGVSEVANALEVEPRFSVTPFVD